MSVFHGDWNEDPKEFLSIYLQSTAAGNDNFKARHFINYLGADSDAEDWFDELPEEEKKDWEAIELAFRRRWLKEEVLSTKEAITIENELQPEPTTSYSTSHLKNVPESVPQSSPESPHLEIGPPTHTVAASQSQVAPGNGKNSQIGTTRATTSEISKIFVVFSSTTPSATALDPPAPSTTITAIRTRSKTASFIENHQKVGISSVFSITPSGTLSPSTAEYTDIVTQVHTGLLTLNDVVSQSPALSTTASSSESAQSPASTGHEKSVFLRALFESQLPEGSPVSTTVVMASKTRLALAGFMENCQNLENSPFFTQKSSEPLVPGSSNLEDDVESLPAPTIVVKAHETRSASTGFVKNNQKVEKSLNFAQKGPEPIISGHYKCANHVDSSTERTATATALKTRPAPALFVKIHKNHQKLTYFNQKHLEMPFSDPFNFENSAELLPAPSIAPTKHPCVIPGNFFFKKKNF
jgi:hypothetical protein